MREACLGYQGSATAAGLSLGCYNGRQCSRKFKEESKGEELPRERASLLCTRQRQLTRKEAASFSTGKLESGHPGLHFFHPRPRFQPRLCLGLLGLSLQLQGNSRWASSSPNNGPIGSLRREPFENAKGQGLCIKKRAACWPVLLKIKIPTWEIHVQREGSWYMPLSLL